MWCDVVGGGACETKGPHQQTQSPITATTTTLLQQAAATEAKAAAVQELGKAMAALATLGASPESVMEAVKDFTVRFLGGGLVSGGMVVGWPSYVCNCIVLYVLSSNFRQ